MLRSWIANSVKHRGPEKCAVEKAVAEMPTVIDLEMGLPAYGDQKTALRMDMVALEPGMVDPRTGKVVQKDYANWTTHPNNPMAVTAAE